MNRRSNSYRPQVEKLEDRLAMASVLPAGFSEARVTATGSTMTSPTAMEFSPDGRLWVLEQTGDVNVILNSGVPHVAKTLTVNSNGERGVLGIAFSKNYDGAGPNADYVYIYYTATEPNVHNRVSRFKVQNAGGNSPTLTNEKVILDLERLSDAQNHNGGAIHFGPDGKLYIAVGDNNDDTLPASQQLSQRLDSRFGKILRINPDGTNPPDNPFFVGGNPIRDSIWALGLRNPYTTAFERGTNRFFINDVGEGEWEEINRGIAGSNYGWAGSNSNPLMEGFESTTPDFVSIGTYRDPVNAHDHSGATSPTPSSAAITGGTFYRPLKNQFGSSYAGKYFFADVGGGYIRMIDPANPGSDSVPDRSTAFASDLTAKQPVDLKVDDEGSLYYLSRQTGAVYKIFRTLPVIVDDPGSKSYQAGATVLLTVEARGADLTYRWQKFTGGEWTNVPGGGRISGVFSKQLRIPSAVAGDAGSYRAVVTSRGTNQIVSNSATLTFSAGPKAPTPFDSDAVFASLVADDLATKRKAK